MQLADTNIVIWPSAEGSTASTPGASQSHNYVTKDAGIHYWGHPVQQA